MSETSRQQFQIHLPGLLKVLAENLYSNKKVAIRELLQNAHDSCVRRLVESEPERFKSRVEVTLDATRRVLTISDNGSGLTADEVRDYLSTIGRSYTRELGEKLAFFSPDDAARLIGQFGLGFLSAFLIASEVTLTTRSMQPNAPALRWHSDGDVHYDLASGERKEVGTTVELKLKPAAAFLLNEDVLIETIEQYADFLPVPIYVGRGSRPVNLMTPPWETPEPEAQIPEYIQRVYKTSEPLCIIPLHDQEIDLGHDTMLVPLKGFLFVPQTSVVSVREYGDLLVYIRHMFICGNQRDLLPPWARFVRGVIDCAFLQPTASREEIHQDENFNFARQALEIQLSGALRRIAEDDPVTWKKIVRGHSDVITGWAVQDNEFFDQVADLVVFRTSRGLLNLPEYLETTHGAIYYVTREMGSLQEQLLGEGRGMPVIEAVWFAVTPFLQKYADWKKDIQLVQLDGEATQLLRPVPERPFANLLKYFQKQGVKVKVAAFKPEEVPALMIYPKDAEFFRDTKDALEKDELPGPLAGLVDAYMTRASLSDADLKGTLYLNASNTLITRLAEDPPPAATLDALLTTLYQVARLFAGRMLTPAEVATSFQTLGSALNGLWPQ